MSNTNIPMSEVEARLQHLAAMRQIILTIMTAKYPPRTLRELQNMIESYRHSHDMWTTPEISELPVEAYDYSWYVLLEMMEGGRLIVEPDGRCRLAEQGGK